MSKVIVRIKGGLGNQLFCYAAARRLALVNNAELIVDDVTGFVRDRQYRRQYALDHFNVRARKATESERLEPFERYRRGAMKLVSRRKPFALRQYLEQEGQDFDERMLSIRVRKTLFLDGLWQSEGYFKDIEPVIRDDLRVITPVKTLDQRTADKMRTTTAVCVHVRWFDAPGAEAHNVSGQYYRRAIDVIEGTVESPHYFVFSDDPVRARDRINVPDGNVTLVLHNRVQEQAWADLWLMTQCRHFITANSTFSWWGAWLGARNGSIVITPRNTALGDCAWGFSGVIPSGWIQI